jgi:hypothetical protein
MAKTRTANTQFLASGVPAWRRARGENERHPMTLDKGKEPETVFQRAMYWLSEGHWLRCKLLVGLLIALVAGLLIHHLKHRN